MNDTASDGVRPMQNSPRLGELIRESMDDLGRNMTETAAQPGCERGTLSRLLNSKADVSANMALEDPGWGNAGYRMRMQASHERAPVRRDRIAARGRAARVIGRRANAGGRGTDPAAVLHPQTPPKSDAHSMLHHLPPASTKQPLRSPQTPGGTTPDSSTRTHRSRGNRRPDHRKGNCDASEEMLPVGQFHR